MIPNNANTFSFFSFFVFMCKKDSGYYIILLNEIRCDFGTTFSPDEFLRFFARAVSFYAFFKLKDAANQTFYPSLQSQRFLT